MVMLVRFIMLPCLFCFSIWLSLVYGLCRLWFYQLYVLFGRLGVIVWVMVVVRLGYSTSRSNHGKKMWIIDLSGNICFFSFYQCSICVNYWFNSNTFVESEERISELCFVIIFLYRKVYHNCCQSTRNMQHFNQSIISCCMTKTHYSPERIS